MNKTEAIDKMIETIYNNNSDLIMTEIDVKKLNEFFKSSLVFEEEFDKFFEENISDLDGISKLKSGKYEMEKQAEIARLDENISRIRNIASNRQGVRQ